MELKTMIQTFSSGTLKYGHDPVNAGYVAGIVVALLLLCYLIYSLINPEKF